MMPNAAMDFTFRPLPGWVHEVVQLVFDYIPKVVLYPKAEFLNLGGAG
jgi:hypothetical protein